MISANVIAEVMTAVPRSGGLFVPARAAFGRPGGLLIGWTDWLNQIAGIAALSIACGEFLALIVPTLQGHQGATGAAISLVLVLINLAGVREGSAVQIAGSALKIMLLIGLAFAVFLMPSTAPASAAPAEAIVRPLSLWGIVVAYQLILGVMAGWPNPAYFSEEDTAPGSNIPRALFSSILAVSALYLLVNGALIYALPLDQLRASELPIALALSNIFGPLSIKIVAAAAIVIILTCNNANFMVGSRVLYGLAQEGLFPPVARRVNRGGTPHIALILTAVFALLLTLTGKFELMFLIMGALGLLPLIVAEAAIFKLRKGSPELPRPYRAFAYPWLPALALLIDVSLLILFIAADWKSGLSIVVAVAICIPIGWVMRISSQSARGGGSS
jgi:APA family basic amino acid/polyamine antiporter